VNPTFNHPSLFKRLPGYCTAAITFLLLCLWGTNTGRGEAMLELFQTTWPELTQKMPEIAEAGYDSLWLPSPAKGNSGTFSVGYDLYDPFDLGSTNQQGTIATAYGTQAQLVQMVQMAHRFGIRVYFDNIMNHRSTVVPGYPNSGISTNYYPGMIPQDFHLQVVSGGYQNWPTIGDPYWCTTTVVENQPLEGLCDIANEPGNVNYNFGPSLGDTTNKPIFIRFPGRPDLYMDTNAPQLAVGWGGAGWHPFDGNGQPVPEDASTYLCRAAGWTLYITKCDGFRLDAVKHTPVDFFGNESGQVNDPAGAGYTGMIQAQFDWVHGYGTNVTGNGYMETNGNRYSLFDLDAPRANAMLFGEYEPAALDIGNDFYDYLNSGMRLLDFPLYSEFYNITGNGFNNGNGMDQGNYTPPGENCDANGNFSINQGVNLSMTQDGGTSGGPYWMLQDAYDFAHEGLPMFYSDGFNHAGAPNYFPNSCTNYYTTNCYLGEYSWLPVGGNRMPDIAYTHNQLARGGTWSRWHDADIVMFERYDYRDGADSNPQDQDVVLFGENCDFSYPGDISFDDGVARTSDGYYLNYAYTAVTNVSNSRGVGICVGFPPGSVLSQLSSSGESWGGGRAYTRLLVHTATNSMAGATSSANAANPQDRAIYIGGQTIPSGGGAIELTIPSGSWVMYGYQWPQACQANPETNAIIFTQGGVPVPHITIVRQDGVDGDTNYNPIFPFKMRGSVDPYGNMIGGQNVSNLTYAIDIPVVTNGLFNILVCSDASTSNTLVKLDGGIDLNSQMGLGPTTISHTIAPTNFPDFRDNKPGYADDVYLGYEQTAFQFRNGPEKFAAENVASNTIVSLGAETYFYTVGQGNSVVHGSGYGANITNQTAQWVFHNPNGTVTVLTNTTTIPVEPATQMVPTNPAAGEPVNIWIQDGYQFQINTCFIYYTTDGSNPEGAFGIGKGTTQVINVGWANHDAIQNNIDWWMGTIPGQPAGTQVRYKIGLFNGGSYGYSIGNTAGWPSIQPISDAEVSGSKLFGITQAAITNFNPTTALVWTHNDLNTNNTTVGLQTGFHIVRARVFLPRSNRSAVYNTFLQTFYYDGSLPSGVIATPSPDGYTITNQTYTVVVRGDSSVTEADVNVQESVTNNYDIYTGQNNGLGNDINGNPIFVPAAPATPNATLSAQYTNFPQEFHYTFPYVPNSGTATITVKLKEYTTGIYTNRYTTLSRAVNTVAPVQVIEISNPSTDGQVVTLPNGQPFVVQACFSTNQNNNIKDFSVYINGVFQSRGSFPSFTYSIGGTACGNGMSMLQYNWSTPLVGTNVIMVINTNSPFQPSDTKSVYITPPLQISTLDVNNQLMTWASSPGINYEVLATTNLLQPFEPISGIVPSDGSTTFYNDSVNVPPVPQKYYEIEVITNAP
jgi:hypothetical protein